MFELGRSSSVGRAGDVVGPRRAASDALLAAAGHGDLDAFADLYDATAPRILGAVQAVLGRSVRAERVVEEVYFVLWRGAPAFDPAVRSADATLSEILRRVLVGPVRAAVTTARGHRRGFSGAAG